MHGAAATGGGSTRVSYRDVFAIAVPIMLSNASAPMIGFVDAAVVGQLGAPALIGGVAMAAIIFNAIYWVVGFLRMSTTGFAAQAVGARDEAEVAATLARALILAVGFGLLVVIFRAPILAAFLSFLGGSADVQHATTTYYDWRIWATPAGLINLALMGWFIGLGRASLAFALQLGLNLLNMALAIFLALSLGHGVAGVGAAALIAEWSAAVAGLVLAVIESRRRGSTLPRATLRDAAKLRAMIAANRDIMIRTACVLATSQLFMKVSAAQGETALAANALLLNILFITYYLLDGYANAAETLVGQAIGARDRPRLDDTVTKAFIAGGVTALVVSVILWLFVARIVAFMTANAEVQALAATFMPWAIILPSVAVWCFVYDGIFIGATRTGDMRDMMIVSVLAYLAALAALVPAFGNHGVWAAHMLFFIVRAFTLRWKYPALALMAGGR